MRWFKHLTGSWEDEGLASIVADYGLEMYGFWWRLLEIIGKQMDASPKTFCQYSPKTWAKFAGVSPKKFEKYANILKEKKLIFVENGDGEMKIDVPNMLKFRDEWTQRQANEKRKTRE